MHKNLMKKRLLYVENVDKLCYNKILNKTKPKTKKGRSPMTITRITKNEYNITAADITFSVKRTERFDQTVWVVLNFECSVYRSCDTLEEAIDYIDFIMCI